MSIGRFSLIAAFAQAAMAVSPDANAQQQWDWVAAPYLWMINVKTDLDVAVPSGGNARKTSFGDIIDKLDGAFQIHGEGQGDELGVFADFTYLGLSDSQSGNVFSSDTDLDTRLFELAGVWAPGADRFSGAELFAGLRYIDLDVTGTITPGGPLGLAPVRVDMSESFNDFMIGARYTWALSDRWGLTLRGDGSFGDTEGTWNASVVANFKMKSGAWFFGYRYLDVSTETRDVDTDIVIKGPAVGYGFKF